MEEINEKEPSTTSASGVPLKRLVSLHVLDGDDLSKVIRDGIDKFFAPIYIGAVIIITVLWIFSKTPYLRDDTDPPGGRSGLIIKTDARTGCQYLATSHGITPRIDRDGLPICE